MLAIYILFYLISGNTPIDLFINSIKAINNKETTINLYATDYFQENDKEKSLGWSDFNKVIAEPDNSPEANFIKFNSSNSAIYRGGKDSFEISNFKFLKEDHEASTSKEEIYTNQKDIEPKTFNYDEYVFDLYKEYLPEGQDFDFYFGETGSSTTSPTEAKDVQPVSSSSSLEAIYKNIKEQATSSASTTEKIARETDASSTQEQEILEEEALSNSLEEKVQEISSEQIEIIPENNSPDSTIEEIIKTDFPSNKSEEISWLDKTKNMFQGLTAQAQEYINKDINSPEELGVFKSAKIKFSFALDQAGIAEEHIVEPIDEEFSSSTDIVEILDIIKENVGLATNTPKEIIATSTETEISTSTEEVITSTTTEFIEETITSPAEEASTTEEFTQEAEEEKSEEELTPEKETPPEETVEIIEPEVEEQDIEVIEEETLLAPEAEEETTSFLNKFLAIARAQDASLDDAKIIIWYAFEDSTSTPSLVKSTTTQSNGTSSTLSLTAQNQASTSAEQPTLWQRLDVITAERLSNYLNNGYFSYDAPFLTSWADVENLKLKFEGVVGEEAQIIAYLDSAWVEATYERETELDRIKKRKRWEEALDLLSNRIDFGANERGEFRFRYNKNEDRIWDTLGEILGLSNFWQDVNITAKLVDQYGKVINLPLAMIFEEDGEFTLKLPEMPRDLKPGKYSVQFHIEDNSGETREIFELEQDFSWGVLAINTNKSVYLPDEKAYLQMAVLDDLGHTICDAELTLKIIGPQGSITTYTTSDNTINKNPECGPDNVIDTPDYYAYYMVQGRGLYTITLTASSTNGVREIRDQFEARNEIPFDIERIGPTRIYPKADYRMKIIIKANKNYRGEISEFVPVEYKISNPEIKLIYNNKRDIFGSNYSFKIENQGYEKKLNWSDIEMKQGDIIEINYTFDAPDRSPKLYLIGPLSFYGHEIEYISEIIDEGGSTTTEKVQSSNIPFMQIEFEEARQWQIASDALNQRGKTVKFLAGIYNGGDDIGQNSDTEQTFSEFNFSLAESGVDIKSAFIIFESQIAAYSEGNNTFNGYELAFDACEGTSCSLDPFLSGVSKDDTNVLVYDENESSQVRIIFDVTAEAQLASYTGGGTVMNAQMGYNLKQGSADNAIGNAKAVLVVTYVYDPDTENITNTVVYPLDSATSTDSGSTQARIAGGCTFGDCPEFEYNMEIPDFPGVATSTNRLSEWFTFQAVNDSHGNVDLNPTIRIQGSGTGSSAFHHECDWGGTQGNMPAQLWTGVPDYTENTAQTIEYMTTSGSNMYVMGGEAIETYMASSSAPVKTRTVSFPMGVIDNGGTTALNTGLVDVYFPENGLATGTVDIKKAWIRVYTSNNLSANTTITLDTKVGDNATTTSSLAYVSNAGGTVIKPNYIIYHIIPESDYTELESANAITPKTVALEKTSDVTTQGGTSAELMITYTYSDESYGYLSNMTMFAGQTDTNGNDQSETEITANSVLPEASGKTMLAAGLLASYTFSDSNAGMPVSGSVFNMDTNLAISSPTCTNAYDASSDGQNFFVEYIKDVTSAMNTTDNQSYSACYSNDGFGDGAQGAKMNGVLTYTYQWVNSPPTGTFNSAVQKSDGSGVVDISIEADDPDDQYVMAKIEYATGTSCIFTSPSDPTLDETDENITADYDDPDIENDNIYQVGTADAYITTASGSNSVFFDWFAKTDLDEVDGDYCLRVTANDQFLDQTISATSTVYIDILTPSPSGPLLFDSRTATSITVQLGATTTENNFKEYKVFYKVYDGSDPTDSDLVHASNTDANLGNILFNSATTTTIYNLSEETTYSFSIWAFDSYGNKSTSTRVDILTNNAPTGSFNSAAQKKDGSGVVDISILVDDEENNNSRAKIEYVQGVACDFSGVIDDPTLDESSINSDYGVPVADNNHEYQVGSSTGWILTPGPNNVTFDWLGKTDESSADDTYCLRLTVNDNIDDQLIATTTTLTLDNINPTAPVSLIEGAVTTDSITLIYATTSPATDTNEPTTNAYKIFYKQGTSGVTEDDIEIDSADLDAYDYSGATSTTISFLNSNTWYVFNIWSYDEYGNKATSSEITIKTNATVYNESLIFTNPATGNVAVADDTTEWNFRAVVSEDFGWTSLDMVYLRLADSDDYTTPYDDLEFSWNQTTDVFSETGSDIMSAVILSDNSSSTCAVNTCTLDFKLIFDYKFATTSADYNAELYTSNDSSQTALDNYDDIYQVKYARLKQIHYRWRNDDGGE